MTVWLENTDKDRADHRSRMSDVSFRIECPCLPVDHAYALAESLSAQQPWIKHAENAGIHPIHVAGSQNGWQRPDNDQTLLLSKRTRLKIRINSDHADKLIASLKDTGHTIGEHKLNILDGRASPLQAASTLLSRYTVYEQDGSDSTDEEIFVQRVISNCEALGYTPTKILCGRTNAVTTIRGAIQVRSVLLADVPVEHSLLLQEKGLGDLRLIGCGILIPHKDTAAVD